MAILNAENTQNPQPSAPPEPSNRRGFFLRSLVPRTAINCSISLSLFPPHALTRHSSQSHFSSARQLVTSQSTSLSVFSVDEPTESLLLLTRTQLFVPVIALASLPSPIPSRDVLLALTSNSKVAFLRYDDQSTLLSLSGDVSLPHPAACTLATHPTRPLVAVPTLTNSLTVFPLLFLPKTIAAGKLTTVPLSGAPLSLTFLHDDNPLEAVLLVLEQYHEAQILSLFTVTPTPDGLSVVKTASMIPCSTRPEDSAVARAEAKFTGQPPRRKPRTTAITRLPGCPYMFAVFVEGKVVAANAQPILQGMLEGKPGPVAMRLDELEQADDHKARLRDLLSSSLTTAQRDAIRVPEAMAATQTPEMGVSDVPMFPMTPRRGGAAANDSEGARRGRRSGDDYVSYLSVPAHLSLGVAHEDGNVTAWTDGRDHFRDDNGDGNGVYFTMQGGGLYVLRWNESIQAGTTSFRVPIGEQITHPGTTFRVQYIGDVGPARSLSALCGRLLFVANDCADGSLRKLSMPSLDLQAILMAGLQETLRNRGLITPQDRRFGLEVRQEFLNLAPISDFVIIPPSRKSISGGRRSHGCIGDHDLQEFPDGYQASNVGRQGAKLEREPSAEPAVNLDKLQAGRPSHRGSFGDNGPHLVHDRLAEEDVQASSHALFGSSSESEIVVCSGFGRFGSVRLIRPGAPVSIFASSARTFAACNDMFPIRFTSDSAYHAGLALTFAERTGILYSTPVIENDKAAGEDEVPAIANLIDGTEATGLISFVRTISIGALEDGILAQIHERGVRLMFLKAADDLPANRSIEAGVLKESLHERVMDWSPPDGGFISVGTIGAGFVIVCVIQKGGQRPLLCLLKLHPGDIAKGLVLVSSDVLEQELSTICIPEGTANRMDVDVMSSEFPPVAILGTHEPSVEVRLLGPSMEVLDKRVTSPWRLNDPSKTGSAGGSMRYENIFDESDAQRRDGARERDTREKVFPSFAIPESICAVEFNKKRLIFAGLRDGSVVCYSFSAVEWIENAEQDSFSLTGGLILESHRKLGHRPVVLKVATVAIGIIVLAQAERPWMCTLGSESKMRWFPLSFTETSAICAYSILGAERCIAMVGEDSALHICGIRRATEVSIRSIHIGSTPRRVVPVSHPKDSIIVATTRENANLSSSHQQNEYNSSVAWMSNGARFNDPSMSRTVNAELRVFSRKHRVQTGSTRLLPTEQVHVLFEWLGFVVVGTSEAQPDQGPAHPRTRNRGRLRLFSLSSRGGAATDSESAEKTKLALCSEVALPGAVLAGAGHPSHPTASILLVSCDNDVIVFGVSKSQRVLVEITRTSTRSRVVGISIFNNMVCVSDRKDSIGFYSLKHVFATQQLIRDRTDHRRRIISDAVMVEDSLAFAVDRTGLFFSIGYEDGDFPNVPPERAHDRLEFLKLLDRCELFAASQDAKAGDESLFNNDSFQMCAGSSSGTQLNVSGPSGSNGNMTEGSVETIQITMNSDGTAQIHQPPQGGSDHVMTAGNAESQDEIASGPGSGVDVAEDGGTNSPHHTESTDDVAPDGAVAGPDIGNNTGDITASGAGRCDSGRIQLPKNLVCNHNFNLADTSLRLRYGSFNRTERTRELEEQKRPTPALSDYTHGEVFQTATSAVFCGTLGGAMMAAVPVCAATFALLNQVEAELSVHARIAGPALGNSHESFRAAYSSRPEGILDGDLLDHFSALDREDKLEICERAGHPGEKGMLHVEALIRDLFDRVA